LQELKLEAQQKKRSGKNAQRNQSVQIPISEKEARNPNRKKKGKKETKKEVGDRKKKKSKRTE
jgi:hypothetical protein